MNKKKNIKKTSSLSLLSSGCRTSETTVQVYKTMNDGRSVYLR